MVKLATVLAVSAFATTVGAQGVDFFSNSNHTGRRWTPEFVSFSIPTEWEISNPYERYWDWNDRVRSIRMDSEISRVTLFEHRNFGGAALILTQSVPDLAAYGWANRASSFQIGFNYPPAGCVRIFEHNLGSAYEGLTKRFCGSVAKLSEVVFEYDGLEKKPYNDMISSLNIGANTAAYFYEHSDYQGAYGLYYGSAANIWVGHELNDKFSSVRILRFS